MRNLVVLGGGEAGINFIKKVREKNKNIGIVLVDKNKYYYNKKEFISSLDIRGFIDLEDFAEQFNIQYIQDYIEKINIKNRKIKLKNRGYIDFDLLIIATGLVSKKQQIKGTNKDGFFYFSSIDPFKIKELLKISDETTIYVSTILGLKLAVVLSKIVKGVNVIGGNLDFLDNHKERVLNFLKSKNINIYTDSYIEEIIGEGIVKAIKISPLKILASCIVFVDSGFLQNIDFFDEPIKIDNFFTDYEGVYFLGDVNRVNISDEYFYCHNSMDAQLQASILADFILGGPTPNFSVNTASLDKNKVIEEFLNQNMSNN